MSTMENNVDASVSEAILQRKRVTYEGMFLMSINTSGEYETLSEIITSALKRREGEILTIKPWDQRKLAYVMKGQSRGFYILTYFTMDPLLIRELEHDCRLDERFLRILIIRKDSISQEVLDADTPAMVPQQEEAPSEGDTPEKTGGEEASNMDEGVDVDRIYAPGQDENSDDVSSSVDETPISAEDTVDDGQTISETPIDDKPAETSDEEKAEDTSLTESNDEEKQNLPD